MSEQLKVWWTDGDYYIEEDETYAEPEYFQVVEKSAYDALAERLRECEAALEVYKAEEFRDAHFGQALSVLMAEEIFDYGKTAREYFEKYKPAP